MNPSLSNLPETMNNLIRSEPNVQTELFYDPKTNASRYSPNANSEMRDMIRDFQQNWNSADKQSLGDLLLRFIGCQVQSAPPLQLALIK